MNDQEKIAVYETWDLLVQAWGSMVNTLGKTTNVDDARTLTEYFRKVEREANVHRARLERQREKLQRRQNERQKEERKGHGGDEAGLGNSHA